MTRSISRRCRINGGKWRGVSLRIQQDIWIKQSNSQLQSATVTGYTDAIGGNSAYNQNLSTTRAQAVRDYLVANGFPPVPITVQGLGATDLKVPLDQCPGDKAAQIACQAPNRRVIVTLQVDQS